MTILGKENLTDCGPYIEFCILEEPLNIAEHDWPSRSKYQHGIFFEFADDLLGTYCSVTRSYSPFDPYGFIQYKSPYDIYAFAAKLLMWEYQLAIMSDNYFGLQLEYFTNPTSGHEDYTMEHLKTDLLDTLHFLVGKLYHAAANKKIFVIVGI
ncbi:MAG: hypothetical protein HOP23_16235 [Methylococcaceae bacterium]|nr:hypothetical protein [Methylococcaceae bacterium]